MTDHDIHDHELDLIMALAEGSLAGADKEAAEATLAACDGCMVELGAQRLALEALQQAPAAALTDLEGARMRRDLRDALGLVEPTPVAAEPRTRAFRWQRLSVALSAAAVLLLFVAIVPALDLFGSSNDSSDDSFAFNTTTAVTAEAVPEDAKASDEMTASTRELQDAGGDAPTLESAPTVGDSAIDFGDNPDLALVQQASQRGLVETGDATNLLGYDFDFDSVVLDPTVEMCVEETLSTFAGDTTAVALGAGSLRNEDVFFVAYVNEAEATVELIAHDASTCEFLASAG